MAESSPTKTGAVPRYADPLTVWSLADAMASTPGMIEDTINVHVPAIDGRCDGCNQVDFLTWWPCAMVSIALVAHIIASRAGAPTIFSFFDDGEDEEADPDCMPKPRAYQEAECCDRDDPRM